MPATVLVDHGETAYSNGNDFHFDAFGATTPALWHDLVVYLIAMQETTNNVLVNLKLPRVGRGSTPVDGHGTDNALFSKIALPLGHGWSAGVLLSYERSHFDGNEADASDQVVRYDTRWRPSGGFGVAWQPTKQLLFGIRALFNNDLEQLTAPGGVNEGLARSSEFRIGGSLAPWEGALIDVGGTHLEKRNAIAGTHTVSHEPNIGFEQSLWARHLTLRLGVDETSPTAGLSARYAPFNLDIAYVRNMARNRVGELFGTRANSILATFTLDYGALTPAH